jgi:hypothetical protein
MARRPMLSLFGSTQNRPTQAQEAARRSILLESLLCIAIRRRVLVKCRYTDDSAECLFEPVVRYLSGEHTLCVRGVEVVHPEMPSDNLPVRIPSRSAKSKALPSRHMQQIFNQLLQSARIEPIDNRIGEKGLLRPPAALLQA